MIEQLFGSKTRVKLLQLFYSNPNRPFYVREITRKIDEQINSVRRELANLLSIGIISSTSKNNKLYYEVSQDYEYYQPFRQVFGGEKVAAKPNDADGTEDALKSLGNVDKVIFTGQFTGDETSGIDILIVGDVNPTQTEKYVKGLEKTENKELRYATMDKKEFSYRKEVNDRFLTIVLSSKKQVVFDKEASSKKAKKKEKVKE